MWSVLSGSSSSSGCLCSCCLWGFASVFLTSSTGNPLASNILARWSISGCLLVLYVTDYDGSVTHAPHHSCQHSGMMVGMVWDVPIRMGRFPVYCSDSLSLLCVTRTSRNASCPSFSQSFHAHLNQRCPPACNLPLRKRTKGSLHSWMSW